MSERDDTVPLRRMLDSARAALELLSRSRPEQGIEGDRLTLALGHAVQATGFAAAHVSATLRRQHPEVPWDALHAKADALLTDYDHVDGAALHADVRQEYPGLLAALERIVEEQAQSHRPGAARRVAVDEVERRLRVAPERLERFCRDHHIRRLAVFGSVLREDFQAGSDVDVIVEFEPGKTPGLDFFAIEEELSTLLGRRVDLLTRQSITPYLRDSVGSQAQELYVAGR